MRDWRREPRHTALGGLLAGDLRFAWPGRAGGGAADGATEGGEDAGWWEGLTGLPEA